MTTTSPENVEHLLAALTPTLSAGDFDLVLDATGVDAPKPDPAAYRVAVERLGVDASDCVAVEELRFGDNDTLSAQVAALCEAQWLFLLTDVDGEFIFIYVWAI